MKHKKYEIGPYNLHIIQNSKFKVNRFVVQFKAPLIKENMTKRILLKNVLLSSTKKYNTDRLMNIRTEELYGLPYGGSVYKSGNFHIMGLDMEFLNDKYIPESIFEESINFMMDILFNPNVENKKFDEKIFEINKENLRQSIESADDNPGRYSTKRLLEEIDKDSPISYHSCGYLEDLELITNENLYEYYLDVLKKDVVDIFILGDFDIDYVKNIMISKVKINTIKKKMGDHFIKHTSFRKRSKSVIESKSFNQSKLAIGCKLKDLTQFEINYVSNIYSYILGGSADSLLFKSVREKNSLCYYISASIDKVSNGMIITSGIDKKDYKKAVRLIKKAVKDMTLGKFDDKYIENGKTTYLNACKELSDSPSSLLGMYISNEYLGTDLLEEREKQILKVTKNDVVEFAKKVYLDTVFLLEGNDKDGN